MYINPYKAFTGCFIPNWLLKSDIVSLGAKVVYARLCQYAGEHGLAYPKREALAEECGCPLRSVARYLDELKDAKLIEVERKGLQMSNRYRFLHHEMMVLVAHQDVHNLAHQEVPDLAHPIEENQKKRIKVIASETRMAEVLDLLPPSHRISEVETSVKAWFLYRTQRKFPQLTEVGAQRLAAMLAKWTPEQVAASIDRSISFNYQGLFAVDAVEPAKKPKYKQLTAEEIEAIHR